MTLPVILLIANVAPGQAQGPGNSEPPAVRVELVSVIEGGQPKPYNGFVVPKEEVNIVPRVSGYLEKVAFEEGAHVEKGDLLFEIEGDSYEISVRVAEATVRQIEAEVELAKRDMERMESLRKTKAVTEQEADESRRTVALQEAKLDEARANLDQAKKDLSYTKIYAPLSGRVGAKTYSEGNYITPNSGVLATIIQENPITVKFAITELDLKTYMKNSKDLNHANIEILGVDYLPFEGDFEIDFIDNRIDKKTNMIMVYLKCENKVGELYPGGFTKINLSERFDDPQPAINISALMTDGGRHYVYVLDKDNKAQRKNVVVGLQVYDRQVIKSGLNIGDKVIVGGLNKVRAGTKVRPVMEEAQTNAVLAKK